MLDDNEIKGAARDVGGKIQDAVGGLTGDSQTQAEGKWNQAAGKAQQKFGTASEDLRDTVIAQPLTALAVVGVLCLAIGYLAKR